MASTLVREMLDAGIHFGHHTSRWDPKMKDYIYGSRNSIHIVDIRETLRGLLRAQKFISRVVSDGDDVLFVGTKRQARESVRENAERCGMHYVTERWLGGTLTNFRTIRSRLQRLEELESLTSSPTWETGYSKKIQSTMMRELRKIRRNLSGIRKMSKLPGALVVVDVRKEVNALREARALNIPTVCLIDTDSDPDLVSIPIPGNDDAMRAIHLVTSKIAEAVEAGVRGRPEVNEPDDGGDGPGRHRRRGRRGGPVSHSGGESAESPVSADPATLGLGGGRPAPAPEPVEVAANSSADNNDSPPMSGN